jgi:hypothetical protein
MLKVGDFSSHHHLIIYIFFEQCNFQNDAREEFMDIGDFP